jgi:hypothetical protein
MQLKAYLPPYWQVKSLFSQLAVIALVYFAIAYFGTFLLVYISGIHFFEFSAIAIAAIATIKYGWTGILGATLGSLCFRLLDMPWEVALYFALSAGFAAYLFRFCFNWFHPSIVVLNQVSSVASFALVLTPIVWCIRLVHN